jgi:very-short-patch-repair endonuclease
VRQSELEFLFEQTLKMRGGDLPPHETQYRFHPPRKWMIDVCWTEKKLAVELEGAVWTNGRHTRGSGFLKDIEKYNQLTLDGYRLLRFTTNNLTDDPDGCIDTIRTCLNHKV